MKTRSIASRHEPVYASFVETDVGSSKVDRSHLLFIVAHPK